MAGMEGICRGVGRSFIRELSHSVVGDVRLTLGRGQVNGWTGLVRVDGETFIWMGAPLGGWQKANQTSLEYTSTKSVFTVKAGDIVEVKITFLSPLTPEDFRRQSLIFSYMQVEVSSIDGKEHSVQIYTDISAGACFISTLDRGIG